MKNEIKNIKRDLELIKNIYLKLLEIMWRKFCLQL